MTEAESRDIADLIRVVKNAVRLKDQSTIGNWQSAMFRDPLNLIRLAPSKGETAAATVLSF